MSAADDLHTIPVNDLREHVANRFATCVRRMSR